MNLAPQFVLLLDSSGLRDLPTVVTYDETLQADFKLRHPEKSFGNFVPLPQQTISWTIRMDLGKKNWEKQKLYLEELLGTPNISVSDRDVFHSYLSRVRNTTVHHPIVEIEPHQENAGLEEYVVALSRPRHSLWADTLVDVSKISPRLPSFTQGAFLYLEHARHLLSERQIGAARHVLARGVKRYPDDGKLSKLLRAITPGHVTKKTRKTENRKREMRWLAKHGEKYPRVVGSDCGG